MNCDIAGTMITELRDDLINFLRALPEIKKASRYNGELEQDGEWHPVMPAAFVNFTKIKPGEYMSDLKLGRNRYEAEIYIVDKLDCAGTTEEVIAELDETETEVDDYTFKFKINDTSFLGHIRAAEVWLIKIEIA